MHKFCTLQLSSILVSGVGFIVSNDKTFSIQTVFKHVKPQNFDHCVPLF